MKPTPALNFDGDVRSGHILQAYKPPLYDLYILQSESKRICTYVGITKHHTRRLRQHNGEIKGGAKQTRAHRPWKRVLYVTGFTSDAQARSLEKRMHMRKWKVRGKGMSGLRMRLCTLERILKQMFIVDKKCVEPVTVITTLSRHDYQEYVKVLSLETRIRYRFQRG